jgi:His/Glu/Gln/Arg/opine family amino acid ABC transporter permease subunit
VDQVIQQYFDWDAAHPYLTELLQGFWTTLQIAFIAEGISLTLGIVLALMRRFRLGGRRLAPARPPVETGVRARVGYAGRRALRWCRATLPRWGSAVVRFLAIAYIDVFRGLPALLVLLLMYGSFPFLPIPVIKDLSGFQIGCIGLGIVYAAYVAEVYRAGIDSVDRGQTEAARSLGMSGRQAMWLVVLPQAVRRVLPPLMNDFIALTKDVALVGVLAVSDVVAVARDAQSVSFNSSTFIVAALFYLVFTLPLIRVLDYVIAREQQRTGRRTVGIP